MEDGVRHEDYLVWFKKRKRKIFFRLALLCLVLSLVFLLLALLSQRSSFSGKSTRNTIATQYGVPAGILVVIGGLMLIIIHCTKSHGNDRSSSSPAQVSETPAEDLENTPAPFLPYNHPRQLSFQASIMLELSDYIPSVRDSAHVNEIVASSRDLPDYLDTLRNNGQIEVEPSSTDLPNYFTVVRNAGHINSSMDVNSAEEGIPLTPPPSYEQALEMALSTAIT